MWDVLPLNVPKGLMVLSRFQGQKVPIWTFVIFGYLKNVICSSVYLVNFDDLKRLCLKDDFQFTLWNFYLTLENIVRSNQNYKNTY